MGTDYKFYCKNCNQSGGWFSRQAWGWGNADIIKSFKFLFYHINKCGEDNLSIISEYDNRYNNEIFLTEFIINTKGMFPRSNDWDIGKQNDKIIDMEKAWEKNKRVWEQIQDYFEKRGMIFNKKDIPNE